MINSNYKSNEEENIPFGIHPSKNHSHSLTPCAPAFLVGATRRRRRMPKKEGHQPLYTPPLGHPRDPALRRANIEPSVGPLPVSLGHPCALRRAPVPLRRAPVHPPLGTRPGVRLPCSPIGYRGLLRRASPSGYSVRLLRLAHHPTICINILAYHDYVYIILL
jgi:hypothetical protein